MKILLFYLAFINIIAMIVTIYDKASAVRGGWRVKERTLMLISALGGAPAMLITMLIIRHKTRKPLFMIGIPVILVLELIIVFLVNQYVYRIL